MRNKTFYSLIFMLVVIFFTSIYLERIDFSTENPAVCGVSEFTNCQEVQTSPYSETFGMKNTQIGIFASLILLILLVIYKKKENEKMKNTLLILFAIGSLFAFRFIFIQLFIIKYICPFCMVIDILLILSLLIFYLEKK